MIRLDINAQRTRAVIPELMPPVTGEDISTALKSAGIVAGVQTEVLHRAVEQVNRDQLPLFDIEAARVPTPVVHIDFGSLRYAPEALPSLQEAGAELLEFLCGKSEAIPQHPAVFVGAGERAVIVSLGGDTVVGHGAEVVDTMVTFETGPELEKIFEHGFVSYRAKIDGYLYLDSHMRLGLWTPVLYNENKTKMYIWIVPVQAGFDQLVDLLHETLTRVDEAAGVREDDRVSRDEVASMLLAHPFEKRPVRKGVDPQPGADGYVELLLAKTTGTVDTSDHTVDFKEMSPYQEVEKSTPVARKFHAVEGKNGKDIFGRIIAVPAVREALFRTGSNITEQAEDDNILYCAGIDGILTLRDDFATIEDVFRIQGDVSITTGNVRYSKDIIVQGSVCAGYTVECGGNLLVRGGVEDNVNITCKGNLVVVKGVFGQRTTVTVDGCARIGFVQNSRLRIEGDLDVRDYIYQSDVFCKGVIQVRGKEIADASRGCVIGGRINSMKAMNLHSVGSEFTRTELACGINAGLFEKLRQLEAVVPVINQKISRLRNQVDFDLNDRTVAELIRRLPEHRRESVRRVLSELKEALALATEVNRKIQTIEDKVYWPTEEDIVITVRKNVVPTIMVRMKNQRFQITRPGKRMKITLKSGEPVCEIR